MQCALSFLLICIISCVSTLGTYAGIRREHSTVFGIKIYDVFMDFPKLFGSLFLILAGFNAGLLSFL